MAADCTAYAYAGFHQRFIRDHITLVGCPKLDSVDSEKLTEILRRNDLKSVTVVRMEVPCCGGIELAREEGPPGGGKFIPWQVVTISTDGRILEVPEGGCSRASRRQNSPPPQVGGFHASFSGFFRIFLKNSDFFTKYLPPRQNLCYTSLTAFTQI